MRQFGFLTGLPRSGSTVLASMLHQHPAVVTTSTSCVSDLMRIAHDFMLGESRYFDVRSDDSVLWAVSRGILLGAYEHLPEGVTVIEKDRHWPKAARQLARILGDKPKMVMTVRPATEILASFLLLNRRIGRKSRIDENLAELGAPINDRARCRLIWERYIYQDWHTAKSLWENQTCPILLLEYSDIVSRPEQSVNAVCDFLGLGDFDVSTDGVVNPSPEDDSIYGLPGLHDVRPKVERVSPPAEEVLGPELYERWARESLDFW